MVTSFPKDPNTPHGGVESVSVNLARALSKLEDLELHVVTTDPNCNGAARSPWNDVMIHRLPQLGRRVLTGAVWAGRRQMRDYLTALAPDIVHAHDFYGLMVKGLSIPRVFTIHGFIYGDTKLASERLTWLRWRIWRHVETSGWADQPHIISISPYVRERLAGISTGTIHDIDNAISPECFGIRRDERKGALFSAALICTRKNQIRLVEAFGKLVARGLDAELRLAGATSEPAYGQRLEQVISTLGLRDRVKLLGRLSAEQVRQELAHASVFVLVSLEENSPMGIEEAMAAGVPVVTSNRCGMPYMVRDGETGFLVDPNNPDDIAWRLGQVLQDDALRASMGAKSREIAQDRFHPAVIARRTREVYLRAVCDRTQSNGFVLTRC